MFFVVLILLSTFFKRCGWWLCSPLTCSWGWKATSDNCLCSRSLGSLSKFLSKTGRVQVSRPDRPRVQGAGHRWWVLEKVVTHHRALGWNVRLFWGLWGVRMTPSTIEFPQCKRTRPAAYNPGERVLCQGAKWHTWCGVVWASESCHCCGVLWAKSLSEVKVWLGQASRLSYSPDSFSFFPLWITHVFGLPRWALVSLILVASLSPVCPQLPLRIGTPATPPQRWLIWANCICKDPVAWGLELELQQAWSEVTHSPDQRGPYPRLTHNPLMKNLPVLQGANQSVSPCAQHTDPKHLLLDFIL